MEINASSQGIDLISSILRQETVFICKILIDVLMSKWLWIFLHSFYCSQIMQLNHLIKINTVIHVPIIISASGTDFISCFYPYYLRHNKKKALC